MTDRTFTVSELGELIRGSLDTLFPYGIWVEGEISGIRRARNGHVYFDLIEPSPTGNQPAASIPVVLFRDSRERVNRLLKRHGDPIRMDDGVGIRIQGMLDFYPPQGRLQLRMSAIDPTYTLGKLAAARDALMRALAEENLLRRNASRPVVPVPLRVALITSVGSAAHADVHTVLADSGHAFSVVEIDSAVQGAGAERHIVAALRTAVGARVDIVVMARGGGSKTDLAVFDHETVARAIAAAPVPVFTGIGHDIDRSVADEVAHTAHTTPTAAAKAVVAVVDTWLHELGRREAELVTAGRRAVTGAEHRLASHRQQVLTGATTALVMAGERLDDGTRRIGRSGPRALRAADARLDRRIDTLRRASTVRLDHADRALTLAEARVRALDPAIALARGWSITRRGDGTVVRSVDDVPVGDALHTRVADGVIVSTRDPADTLER